MKGPSPFSTDQYTPLLCLWGIKSLKHKGRFLHKDPNNGSQDIFFPSLSCFMLYTFFHSFFPLPSLQLSSPEEGGVGLFNEAGNFDFSGSKRLQEANNQSHSNFFLSMFSLYLPDGRMCCSGWCGFTYRFSNIV